MEGQHEIVRKGENCLQLAKDVVKNTKLSTSKPENIKSKLLLLKMDAMILDDEAKELIRRLDAVSLSIENKDADLSCQVGDSRVRENQLNREKQNMESNLAGQRNVLRDKESQLSSAERNLQAAERKLRDREKEERKIQVGATLGGALLGLFTGGAGFLIGAAAGASIGAIVNAYRDEVKDARSALDCRRADVESAKSAVQQSESQISSLKSEINSLSSHIRSLESEITQLREKRARINPEIENFKEFWQDFRLAVEIGGDMTAKLETVIIKANEESLYQVFKSRAKLLIVRTFFEAWKEIASIACEDASNHIMLPVKYTCARCSTISFNDLPHLSGSNFLCSSCAYGNSG